MVNVLTFSDVEILNVVGDIHGKFETLEYNINRRYLIENSVNIVLGDCGIGFHKDEYYLQLFKRLNTKFKKQNNHIIMFRGNHDSPEYFNGKKNKLFEKFSHIHVIPDYTIVTLNDRFNILCIGGGISIDRLDRLNEMSKNFQHHSFKSEIRPIYWENENVVYNEFKLDEINKQFPSFIHMVATHSCPDFIFPTSKVGVKGWIARDPYLEEDLNIERGNMTQIYNHLITDQKCILTWVYGHFHMHNIEYDKENIKFFTCECETVNEIRF